ncbi:MAG: SDR family NAD(P)-dependent oxidoreductase [Crocinitomicaceae bacterium]|nr:SDR family NAD(P)-dependent oxidoreductase [Crocinitomicaceae bacterium]
MQKIIVVTGGNRGIGLEICKQLAAKGHIVIMGCRDEEKGKQVADSINGVVIPKKLDVTNKEDAIKIAKETTELFGPIDVLINNAGVMSQDNVLEVSAEEQRRVMETNVLGPLQMTQAFAPFMQESDDPRIINISSQMGQRYAQTADHSAYRLSKYTLNGLTLQLADALPNFKVNCMHPGWVKTDMGGESAPLSVEEGADTAVWLATAEGISSGGFYCERGVMEW